MKNGHFRIGYDAAVFRIPLAPPMVLNPHPITTTAVQTQPYRTTVWPFIYHHTFLSVSFTSQFLNLRSTPRLFYGSWFGPRFRAGSAQGSVPFYDDEDDSPVEEVSPVKPKKLSRRAAKAKKDEPKEVKETPKEWTVEEEIALCQGWCDVSENSISGNS
nr:hypothetical protein [Tanacetum cinerariifolium]